MWSSSDGNVEYVKNLVSAFLFYVVVQCSRKFDMITFTEAVDCGGKSHLDERLNNLCSMRNIESWPASHSALGVQAFDTLSYALFLR